MITMKIYVSIQSNSANNFYKISVIEVSNMGVSLDNSAVIFTGLCQQIAVTNTE